MKKLTVYTIIGLLSIGGYAQHRVGINFIVGPEFAGFTSTHALQLTANYKYFVNDNFAIGAKAGLLNFGKTTHQKDVWNITTRGGLDFLAAASLDFFFLTNKMHINGEPLKPWAGIDLGAGLGSEIGFFGQPRVGVAYDILKRLNLETGFTCPFLVGSNTFVSVSFLIGAHIKL